MRLFLICVVAPIALVTNAYGFSTAMGFIRESSDISVLFGVTMLGAIAFIDVLLLKKLFKLK